MAQWGKIFKAKKSAIKKILFSFCLCLAVISLITVLCYFCGPSYIRIDGAGKLKLTNENDSEITCAFHNYYRISPFTSKLFVEAEARGNLGIYWDNDTAIGYVDGVADPQNASSESPRRAEIAFGREKARHFGALLKDASSHWGVVLFALLGLGLWSCCIAAFWNKSWLRCRKPSEFHIKNSLIALALAVIFFSLLYNVIYLPNLFSVALLLVWVLPVLYLLSVYYIFFRRSGYPPCIYYAVFAVIVLFWIFSRGLGTYDAENRLFFKDYRKDFRLALTGVRYPMSTHCVTYQAIRPKPYCDFFDDWGKKRFLSDDELDRLFGAKNAVQSKGAIPFAASRVYMQYILRRLWKIFGVNWSVLEAFFYVAAFIGFVLLLSALVAMFHESAGVFAGILFCISSIDCGHIYRNTRNLAPMVNGEYILFATVFVTYSLIRIKKLNLKTPLFWIGYVALGVLLLLLNTFRGDELQFLVIPLVLPGILIYARDKKCFSKKRILAQICAVAVGCVIASGANSLMTRNYSSMAGFFHVISFGEGVRASIANVEISNRVFFSDPVIVQVAKHFSQSDCLFGDERYQAATRDFYFRSIAGQCSAYIPRFPCFIAKVCNEFYRRYLTENNLYGQVSIWPAIVFWVACLGVFFSDYQALKKIFFAGLFLYLLGVSFVCLPMPKHFPTMFPFFCALVSVGFVSLVREFYRIKRFKKLSLPKIMPATLGCIILLWGVAWGVGAIIKRQVTKKVESQIGLKKSPLPKEWSVSRPNPHILQISVPADPNMKYIPLSVRIKNAKRDAFVQLVHENIFPEDSKKSNSSNLTNAYHKYAINGECDFVTVTPSGRYWYDGSETRLTFYLQNAEFDEIGVVDASRWSWLPLFACKVYDGNRMEFAESLGAPETTYYVGYTPIVYNYYLSEDGRTILPETKKGFVHPVRGKRTDCDRYGKVKSKK